MQINIENVFYGLSNTLKSNPCLWLSFVLNVFYQLLQIYYLELLPVFLKINNMYPGLVDKTRLDHSYHLQVSLPSKIKHLRSLESSDEENWQNVILFIKNFFCLELTLYTLRFFMEILLFGSLVYFLVSLVFS